MVLIPKKYAVGPQKNGITFKQEEKLDFGYSIQQLNKRTRRETFVEKSKSWT